MTDDYILPQLGQKTISRISYSELDDFCNWLLINGGIPIGCDGQTITIKQQQKEMRVFSRNEQEQLCTSLGRYFPG